MYHINNSFDCWTHSSCVSFNTDVISYDMSNFRYIFSNLQINSKYQLQPSSISAIDRMWWKSIDIIYLNKIMVIRAHMDIDNHTYHMQRCLMSQIVVCYLYTIMCNGWPVTEYGKIIIKNIAWTYLINGSFENTNQTILFLITVYVMSLICCIRALLKHTGSGKLMQYKILCPQPISGWRVTASRWPNE